MCLLKRVHFSSPAMHIRHFPTVLFSITYFYNDIRRRIQIIRAARCVIIQTGTILDVCVWAFIYIYIYIYIYTHTRKRYQKLCRPTLTNKCYFYVYFFFVLMGVNKLPFWTFPGNRNKRRKSGTNPVFRDVWQPYCFSIPQLFRLYWVQTFSKLRRFSFYILHTNWKRTSKCKEELQFYLCIF
jgi:hypothetical protein